MLKELRVWIAAVIFILYLLVRILNNFLNIYNYNYYHTDITVLIKLNILNIIKSDDVNYGKKIFEINTILINLFANITPEISDCDQIKSVFEQLETAVDIINCTNYIDHFYNQRLELIFANLNCFEIVCNRKKLNRIMADVVEKCESIGILMAYQIVNKSDLVGIENFNWNVDHSSFEIEYHNYEQFINTLGELDTGGYHRLVDQLKRDGTVI